MFKFKKVFKKSWIFGTAAAIIVGSSTVMAFALNNNTTEGTSIKVTPSITNIEGNVLALVSKTDFKAQYTVIDHSKQKPNKDLLTSKLKKMQGMTPEKIDQEYSKISKNMIPGEKDISADKAAAYAADAVKKIYGVNLTGYTADASFSKNPVPGSDNWGIIFHAPNETNDSKRYSAGVDSVDGKILDLSCYDLSYKVDNNKDVNNTEWKDKALQQVTKLIPDSVSITDSKVIGTTPETGVTVVFELSNGSACAIRLSGESKEIAAYQYFPNGYDGSWDYHPVTENAVG